MRSRNDPDRSEARPPRRAALWGLVLAGGESRRMGRDKGALDYHGRPQAVQAAQLLRELCPRVWVSVRAEQRGTPPYVDLPLIVDSGALAGPAAGLAAAWDLHPEAAWLVLAADLPRVDRSTLAQLVASRAPEALATVFRHPDGTLEPLCAVWEPRARKALLERASSGSVSLRRVLERAPRVEVLTPDDSTQLIGVNSMREYRGARAARGTQQRARRKK